MCECVCFVIASKSGFKENWMLVRVSLKARVQERIILRERERDGPAFSFITCHGHVK